MHHHVTHAFMIQHSMYYGNMLKAIIVSEFIRFIFCDSAQKYKLFDLKKKSISRVDMRILVSYILGALCYMTCMHLYP